MIHEDSIPETHLKPGRLHFKVDEHYRLIEFGMIENYAKAESIDGELIQKTTTGDRHALVVDLLAQALIRSLPESIRVRIQNPLRLTDFDEPENDIVLADLSKYDGHRQPRPAETLIVIEVSDKTLR